MIDRRFIRQLSFEQDVFKGVLKNIKLVSLSSSFNSFQYLYVLQIQRDHGIQRIKTIVIFASLLTVTMIAREVMMRILIPYLILINR